MATLLLCSARSLELESLSQAVSDAYESVTEDHAIRRLSIHHSDGGLIVQICEEDEEENA